MDPLLMMLLWWKWPRNMDMFTSMVVITIKGYNYKRKTWKQENGLTMKLFNSNYLE